MTRARAFTLIELLVVVAIIGILSAVVLVSLQEAQARARFSQMQAQLREIAQAIEVYELAAQTYPPDVGRGQKPAIDTLSQWPAPPCTQWVYDWDNPGNTNRGIFAKRADGVGGKIMPFGWYLDGPVGHADDIRNSTTTKITCSEPASA